MILVYKTMTKKAAAKIAVEAKEGVKKFFEEHPERRVCNAQLWYQRTYTIKKANVDKQVDDLLLTIKTKG